MKDLILCLVVAFANFSMSEKSLNQIKIKVYEVPPAIRIKNGNYFGSDIKIIEELSVRLNLTYKFTNSSDFDMIIGFLPLSLKIKNNLQHSTIYDFCHLVLTVPHGSKISSLQKLFQAFDNSTWFFTCTIFMLAFMSCFAMNTQSKRILNFIYDGNSRLSYMNIIGGILGTSSHVLQSRRYFSRILWIIFLFFGIIMRCLHQATLFKFLQNDENALGVKSIEEVIEKNFTIYASNFYKDLIKNEKDLKFNFINDFNLKTKNLYFDHESKNFFMIPSVQLHFYNQKYSKQNKLKFLTEPLYTLPVTLFFKEDFALKSKVDEKIHEFQAAGLLSFWNSQGISKGDKKTYVHQKPTQLTLDQLLISFKILIVGNFLSALMFLAEITYYQMIKCTINRK